MGHGFGELYRGIRGIITYRISPLEQKAFAGVVSHGFPNTFRRMRESIFYVVPPLAIAWLIYDQVEKTHHHMDRKNPADFEDEQ